jgi:aspartate/tyrosine/aromatic aminotransferase
MTPLTSVSVTRVDPMIIPMRRLRQDDHAGTVDTGVGIYRNEQEGITSFRQ